MASGCRACRCSARSPATGLDRSALTRQATLPGPKNPSSAGYSGMLDAYAAAERDTRPAAAAYGSPVTGSSVTESSTTGSSTAESSTTGVAPGAPVAAAGVSSPPGRPRKFLIPPKVPTPEVRSDTAKRTHRRGARTAGQDGRTRHTHPPGTKTAASQAGLAQSENHSRTTQRYALCNGPRKLPASCVRSLAKEQPMTDLDASASNSGSAAAT